MSFFTLLPGSDELPDPTGRSPALAPALDPHGPIPPEIDHKLAELALRAQQGDSDARNTLFAAFAPRLDHWVRRVQRNAFRYGSDPALERADIPQQAFIVFAEILDKWNGQGSISGYVIAQFPWRLQDSVRGMSDSRPRRPLPFQAIELLTDDSYAASEANALLSAISASLPDREGLVLVLKIGEGLSWSQIALRAGVDKRTIQRDWRRIMIRLRAELRAFR